MSTPSASPSRAPTLALAGVSASGKLGLKIDRVSLEAEKGSVLAIVGAPRDGTGLLLDVIDGTARPKTGSVHAPARVRVARVTLDAPLPDALRVDEVCALSSALRGGASAPAGSRASAGGANASAGGASASAGSSVSAGASASEVLGALHLESLAKRSVRSLSVDERRAVTLALALAAPVELLLVEEPLALLAPLATRVVVERLRERAKTACVVVATASPRDATRVGDRIAVLADGVLTPIEESNTVSRDAGSLRVVVAAAQGKSGAASLIGALGREDAVVRVDSAAFAAGEATVLHVHGDDLGALAKAVTRAIAAAKVDVDLVEPSIMPLDAIRAQIAAHAAESRS
ncbi:MAG: ATP-binding cassette domain-containing protein [Labilithrix sp.]|nr:ATP-binding cassette domain-containing protein [Labilithrix sp.]MCW5811865.1 ATP-binding cassette domain-containing protein [Labilithrix sp.]